MMLRSHDQPPRCLLLLIILLAVGAGTSPAAQSGQLELEHDLSGAIETPHTAWAKPFAGGTTRALFALPWRSASGEVSAREVVEMTQRFDLHVGVAYHDPRGNQWIDGQQGDDAGLKRLQGLLEQSWDVYVIRRLEPGAFSDQALARIRQAVRDGAGWVLPDEPAWRQAVGPIEPAEKAAGLPAGATTGHVGQGRVVFLPARKPVAYRFGWETEFDFHMQAQGRAMLWAAGREPVDSLHFAMDQPLQAGVADQVVTLGWQSRQAMRVTLRLGRDDGATFDLAGHSLPAGQARRAVRLPAVRAGQYYLQAIGHNDQDQVTTWTTQPVRVSTGGLKIHGMTLNQDWGEVGGSIRGQVQLDHPGGSSGGQQAVDVRLIDRRGRVIAQQRHDPQTLIPFVFPIEEWMPMLVLVQAVLHEDGREIDAADAYFQIAKRHRGQFNFVVWGTPTGEMAPFAVQALAEAGATVILERGTPPRVLAAYDMAYMPYTTWLAGDFSTLTASLNRQGVMRRPCCYNDQEAMTAHVRQIVQNHEPSRRHGVFAYSVGDENAVRGSCLSPHCLAAYRRYLQTIYSDISALNASWGSAFASFDQVDLLDAGSLPSPGAPAWFKDWYAQRSAFLAQQYPSRHTPYPLTGAMIRHGDINDELASLEQGRFARWYDRQAFQTWNLVQAVKQYDAGFRAMDPDALTGFEGTNSFSISRNPTRIREGGDIDLFVREMGWWGPYADLASEVLRSIAPPAYPRGNWIGYFRDPVRDLGKYWDGVIAGMTQVQWWRWDGVGRFHGLLSPHLGPYPSRRVLIEDTQLARDGLADLLMRSSRADDRIGIYYAMPATYIAHFDDNETYSTYQAEHHAWTQGLRDLGLDFRYVTDRQLRRGEFDPDAFDVLILPMGLSLGDHETQVLGDFVQHGGLLIADVRPGMYTHRNAPRTSGSLDDVLGITRTSPGAAAQPAILKADSDWHGQRITLAGMAGRVDPTVRPETAQALGQAGDVPILLINRYGQGHAMLLNFPLQRRDSAAMRTIEQVLAWAGVKPNYRMQSADGPTLHWQALRNAELAFKQGLSDQAAQARDYLAITLDPRREGDAQQALATVHLGQLPQRDWRHYNRLVFSVTSQGKQPAGRVRLGFYSRDEGYTTAHWFRPTDDWQEISVDISSRPRSDVLWIRIHTYGDWDSSEPFTLYLDDLRLVRDQQDDTPVEPEDQAIEPVVALPAVNDRRPVITRWQQGDMQILALTPTAPKATRVRLDLPEPSYVYDIRTGQAHDQTSHVELAVQRDRPSFAVISPTSIAPPQLRMDTQAQRGLPHPVQVRVPDAPGWQALQVEVIKPTGEPADWVQRFVLAGDQPVTCHIPLAFNDPAGHWTVRVTNRLTGQQAEQTLTLP